jgi:hypothetical protein
MIVSIVVTIEGFWFGFRLSLGKGGKGENYDDLKYKII